MTDPQVAMLMMASFIFCILLGFPICFTLVAMGFGFGYYAYATSDQLSHIFMNNIFDLLVNQTYSVMINDVLVAVPLFLFMGYIVERAQSLQRLFYSLRALCHCRRHRRRRGHADGIAGLPGPAESRL